MAAIGADSMPERIATYRARIESVLEGCLPPVDRVPVRLHTALRYSALGAGKRLRPILVYATGEALGAPLERLDAPAAAVELIHAYSLVHDDLPAMDDDDLRRGRPTCHRAFDEGTAILAGDALQVLAFRILAAEATRDGETSTATRMIQLLAEASGTDGMAGGQALDLAAVGRHLTVEELENIHRRKTGALIRASVLMAAMAAHETDLHRQARLDRFAQDLGLAFQIQDDILDVEGDAATLGKPTGADRAKDKPTYPSIAGMAAAKRRCRELHAHAIEALADFGAGAEHLRWLADFVIERNS
ncbi:MAG TPA: farnesyl diphosphate synthase [Steroidobacteraceae bacterium]|nr:farnesyl diphosphate synthase [Steroidobacteraceae bacterium]